MACDFNCWFPGISGFLFLGVRMWTFRLKEQGVCDTGMRDWYATSRASRHEAIHDWKWAPPVQPEPASAAIFHLPKGWQLLGLAGKLHWDGLSKPLASKSPEWWLSLWTGPCGQLAQRDDLWKEEILMIPATQKTAYWVGCEWAFVLKGFAARERGGGCFW